MSSSWVHDDKTVEDMVDDAGDCGNVGLNKLSKIGVFEKKNCCRLEMLGSKEDEN